MIRNLAIVGGLVVISLVCLVLAVSLRGCGSSKTGETANSASPSAPAPRQNAFGLVRHGLDKQAEARKYGPTSGTYKVATGNAAEEAIQGTEDEERLEGQASYEEAQVKMHRIEIQRKQDELARAERKKLEFKDRIADLKNRTRSTEMTLSHLELGFANMTSAEHKITRRLTIDSFNTRLENMRAEMTSLREKLQEASSQVAQLKQSLGSQTTTNRRWNDGKGKIVIEE